MLTHRVDGDGPPLLLLNGGLMSIGAWQAFPFLAVLAGIGIVIGVAYILRTIQKSFYSGLQLSVGTTKHPLEAISIRKKRSSS